MEWECLSLIAQNYETSGLRPQHSVEDDRSHTDSASGLKARFGRGDEQKLKAETASRFGKDSGDFQKTMISLEYPVFDPFKTILIDMFLLQMASRT